MLHNLRELGGGGARVDGGVRHRHRVRGKVSRTMSSPGEDHVLTVVVGIAVGRAVFLGFFHITIGVGVGGGWVLGVLGHSGKVHISREIAVFDTNVN